MNKLTYSNKHLTKLKNQEFINIILLISGEFVSTFGTRIYNFAIAYYILQTTGSALAFSISLSHEILFLMIFKLLTICS